MILLNKKNHVRTSCFQMCRSFSVHTTKPQKNFKHMKLLLFSFLTASFQLCAQGYSPFNLSDSTIWQEAYQQGLGDTPGSQGYQTKSYSFFINGDTLINDYHYKKLYSRIDWTASRHTVYTGPDMYHEIIEANNYDDPYELIGALRQEVENERLYFINWIDDFDHFSLSCQEYQAPFGQEVLLYDFKQSIGDTVYIGDLALTVTDINSIEMQDGSLRKTIAFGYSPSWIAELGGELGLFTPWKALPFESGCFLLCYNHEAPPSTGSAWQEAFYNGNMSEDCSEQIIVSNNTALASSLKITLGPNPTHDYIHLLASDQLVEQAARLLIFNSLGQQLSSHTIQTNRQRLSLQKWPKGSYYLKVLIDGQTIASRKIIKQ